MNKSAQQIATEIITRYETSEKLRRDLMDSSYLAIDDLISEEISELENPEYGNMFRAIATELNKCQHQKLHLDIANITV